MRCRALDRDSVKRALRIKIAVVTLLSVCLVGASCVQVPSSPTSADARPNPPTAGTTDAVHPGRGQHLVIDDSQA